MVKCEPVILEIHRSMLSGLYRWLKKQEDKKKHRDKVLGIIKQSMKECWLCEERVLDWVHSYYRIVPYPVPYYSIQGLESALDIGVLLEELRIILKTVKQYCKIAGIPFKLPKMYNGLEEQALLQTIIMLKYTYMLYMKVRALDPVPTPVK